MKEQFDKKLIEKIKISFEDHEEPFNPQEWEKLSHAYFHPAKKKKFVFWPFLISGIAASLLLVFVFWPFEDELQRNVQTLTDSISIEGKQFEKIELPRDKEQTNLALAEKTVAPTPASESLPSFDEPDPLVGAQRETIEPILINELPNTTSALAPASNNLEKPQIIEDIHKNAANEKVGTSIIAYNSDAEKAQRYLEQWKAEGQGMEPQEESSSNKNVRLGLLVGPQASSNPVSGMSLGAGVMSEFSISKRLKLDVGVTYASHSVVPDHGVPMHATMESPQREAFASLSNSPRLIGTDAELSFSGLDIPVNLKYKVVDKEKSGLFLITGLSSMVYLDQQTTETMAVDSYFNTTADGLEFQRTVQQYTHEAGPESTADGFDLGRMLNLSVGYEYNLKNGTYLSIEPYYKLPLGDMTFANQQFSIGGLNLRMNFRLGK
jgi:hypothetical protein